VSLGRRRLFVTRPDDLRPSVDGRVSGQTPTYLDDQEIPGLRAGDPLAWERVYRAYGPSLYGYLMLKLRNPYDTEDAVAELFARAIARIGGFRGDANSLRAWLFRIAANLASDCGRTRSRLAPAGVLADLEEQAVLGIVPDLAGESLMELQDHAAVREAFARLRPGDQEVLWLRVCAGLAAADVADVLGRRPGAIRMQQMRALRELAGYLHLDDSPEAAES
jgi:RNA polymerase sigma-70 factor (ECF subfamily)